MRRAAILALAFVVLTAAVQAGLLRGVDSFALDHLAPLAGTSFVETVTPADPVDALRPVLHGERSLPVSVAATLFLPADSVSAVVLVAIGALILLRRRRPWAAVAWIGAMLAGFAVEGAGKLVVDQVQYRPGSTVFGVQIDGSYPSGHTIRSVILAALGTMLWPRARVALVAWVGLVTGLLWLGALHVPTEIAGGFLAGGALATAAWWAGTNWPARRAARAVQSGGHVAVQAPRSPNLQAPPGAAESRGR